MSVSTQFSAIQSSQWKKKKKSKLSAAHANTLMWFGEKNETETDWNQILLITMSDILTTFYKL